MGKGYLVRPAVDGCKRGTRLSKKAEAGLRREHESVSQRDRAAESPSEERACRRAHSTHTQASQSVARWRVGGTGGRRRWGAGGAVAWRMRRLSQHWRGDGIVSEDDVPPKNQKGTIAFVDTHVHTRRDFSGRRRGRLALRARNYYKGGISREGASSQGRRSDAEGGVTRRAPSKPQERAGVPL